MGGGMTDAPATPPKLFNSLTRRLEIFEPVHPGVPGDPANPPEARVYSRGPTVHNYPHIGKMRRSEEHPSELQSLMRLSDAVFFRKKQPLHDNKEVCTTEAHDE